LTPPTTHPIRFQAGELILTDYPFTTGMGWKLRPVLVSLDGGDDDVLTARITSRPPVVAFDVSLTDWRPAGLKTASTVRLHKMNAVEKTLVRQRIGMIQPADRQRVADVLRQMFGNW
jgi:mRNA interferase MazF